MTKQRPVVPFIQLHHAQEVAQQAIDDALKSSRSEEEPVYDWEFSPYDIAHSIASQFLTVGSPTHSALRDKIKRAIENERCIMERFIKGQE